MSDVSQSPVAPADAGAVRVPVLLRQAREAAGLHIAALAAALKVPVKKLEALEAGRYDELPDMTFARALASSACRHLKIDPAPVLEQIPLAHRPQLGDSPQAINAPFKGGSEAVPFNPAGWLSRPAVLAAIALLLGALVLVFLPARESEPPAEALMPPGGVSNEAPPAEPGPATGATTMAAEGPAAPVSDAAAPTPAQAQAPAPAAEPPPVAAVTPAPALPAVASVTAPAATAVPGSATTASAGRLLSITVTGESWVEVVNGSNEVVVHRMFKPGEVVDFSTAPPYAVVIGRADAAQVTVRGKPFDITPYARNSVARFEVK